MTQEETKKLRIEFERRLQIMYPNSKYLEKLNSDTIYSILNEYQIKYIKQLYFAQRQQKLGELGAENVDNILQLLCSQATQNVTKSNNTNIDFFDLPEDYWLYVRSSSNGTVNYSGRAVQTVLSNDLIEDKDVNQVIDKYENHAGIIRHPLVIVQNGSFNILHDVYTNLSSVDLTYYRMPKKFGDRYVGIGLQFNGFVSDNYLVAWQHLDVQPEKIVFSTNDKRFLGFYGGEYYESWSSKDFDNYQNPKENQQFFCTEIGNQYIWKDGQLCKDENIIACELPISSFDDLVTGAIKLYVFEYKFALALSASNSKYNKLKKGVDKLAEDNKQEQ